MPNFHESFPFPKQRSIQTEILNKLTETWDKKKFFLIQAPTGVGKSPIAIAIANANEKKCIISTPLKILQDQYVKT